MWKEEPRRYDGRFFGRRVNCEYVPLLPVSAVRRVLDDPRKIPYLLIWKGDSDGQIKEALRLIAYSGRWAGWIEAKREDGL